MRIEKGKLYYDTKENRLLQAVGNGFREDWTDKIAVHCPTKNDWDYVVSKGYDLRSYYGDYYYELQGRSFGGSVWYYNDGRHIAFTITIDEFKKFYPEKINNMTERNLKITKEQAEELLRTTPALTEVIYNSFPELKPRPIVLDKFEDLECVKGYFVSSMSIIAKADCKNPDYSNKNVFVNKKQAESALAYAQLTQLMKATGDCEVDWDADTSKYVIIRRGDHLEGGLYMSLFAPIAFKTASVRDTFLKKHCDLLKQYFQIK